MARIVASFSIVPVGVEGTSLSKYVALALEALDKANIKYTLTPMCTILEGDRLDDIFDAVKKAHEALEKAGVKRILLRISIDDRLDKPSRRPEDKVKAVKNKLGK